MNKILIIGLLAFLLSGCVVEDEQEQGKAWPGGIVYYEFDEKFNSNQKVKVKNCMFKWEEKTNVIFVEKKVKNSVFIFNSPDNMATIGMQNNNYMSFFANCSERTILHELGHILGLEHEHQRLDRDNYIHINFLEIYPTKKHYFSKKESQLYNMGKYSYDIMSIMHYEPAFFSYTLSFEPNENIFGENYSYYKELRKRKENPLTKIDIEKVNNLYN